MARVMVVMLTIVSDPNNPKRIKIKRKRKKRKKNRHKCWKLTERKF